VASVVARARTLALPDGRRLAYEEHGDPKRPVVLYFHGSPGSRIEWEAQTPPGLAEKLGVRLIAIDRPGLGLSDFQAKRQIKDWPNDVGHLADALAIEKFMVLGYSGGVPYALACGAFLPDKVTAVAVVSCTAPFDVPGLTDSLDPNSLRFLRLARDRPLIHRSVLRLLRVSARWTPSRFVNTVMKILPEADRAVGRRPEIAAGFVRTVLESTRRGVAGATKDTELMVSPWGFDVSEVRKHVDLWQGEEDRNTSPAMGRYLAGRLPDCSARFVPGEGHVSLFVNHIDEIVRQLISQTARPQAG
jgi:pimeloyl-ACP methyl ester carboxylesterase